MKAANRERRGTVSAKKTKLYEALQKHGHYPTLPVGVKLVREAEKVPQKIKYPLQDLGNPIALCQGMTIARTMGWAMAFRKEDHACPLAPVFLGQTDPEPFLQGVIAGPYQDDEACAKGMEANFPRWPLNSVREVWLSPLNICEFEPDLAVVYGNPAQILVLVHAANYGRGPVVKSSSCGRGGCSAWTAGVILSNECTYMIPGSGERVFAGTQDHEMSFAIPYSQFEHVVKGLNYVGRKGAYRYPVPNLAILSQPKIPEGYYALDPDGRQGEERRDT
jgi:uncharacterized protein (DUF169 family)